LEVKQKLSLKRIRFDDILWATGDEKVQGKEFQKFKKHIDWCKDLNIMLSPAILCQDIEQFPECMEYIRGETSKETLFPDLHGWTHGPYGDLTVEEIRRDLDLAFEWFDKNLGVVPIRWVTPHGANTIEIQDAAREFGLIVEDTTLPVIDQKVLDSHLREYKDLSVMDNKVLMVHWWERGLRLFRIARIISNGSVQAAIEATKTELDEKSWRICWNEEWLK
jgi:hypothetical protein